MSNKVSSLRRYGDAAIHARRKANQDGLRELIDGKRQIKGILQCIEMAEQAYITGDKDAVPALALKMKGHNDLLKKVLPDLRSVELTGGDGSEGPVLILDLVGDQPYRISKQEADVIDVAPEPEQERGPLVRFDDDDSSDTSLLD